MRYPRRKRHVRLNPLSRQIVRSTYRNGGFTQDRIARFYRVTQPTVSNIVRSG
jgi:predicted XRE-type DNA-binding protein